MNMAYFYLGEALKSTIYLINRAPSHVIDIQTPQQKLRSFCTTAYLSNLEPLVFECTVYIHIPKVLRGKLDLCAKRYVFVGYSNFQKGYRCYDPQNKKLHVTLDIFFHENEPYYGGGVSNSTPYRENASETLDPNKKDIGVQPDQVEFLNLEELKGKLS